MGVLSTLKNYWENIPGEIQGSGLEVVAAHKWKVLAGAVALYGVYKYLARPKNLPPGPQGLPVIGALMGLSRNLHEDFIHYSEIYKSDIISFYIGGQLVVTLNTSDVVKQAYGKTDDFSYRDQQREEDFDFHDQFFLVSYSEEWKKLKTFRMASLKRHGFGLAKSEENIKLQLSRLISHLATLPNDTIHSDELDSLFCKAGGCVIMKILLNQDYEFAEPEFEDMIRTVKEFGIVISLFEFIHFTNVMPKLILQFLKRQYVKNIRAVIYSTRNIFLREMKNHQATLDVDQPRDVMDDFLIRNMKHQSMTDVELLDNIAILSPDAVTTFAGQVVWALFYICWHPEVQEKMLKEITTVCGNNQPGFKDRTNMPYCEAVMWESIRMASVFAVCPVHYNKEDTTLKSYFIPKNTPVLANLYAANYDEKVFPEAHKFMPSRFMSPNGKLANVENVMSFGLGRRKCVGEALVKSEMFLYVTGLIHRFEISFADGYKPASMKREDDYIFRSVPEHKMKFIERF